MFNPEVEMETFQIPVMILVGGKGSRLAGVSELPKPMIEVAGRPFLIYLLAALYKQGFRRIFLLSGYKADLLENGLRTAMQTQMEDWLGELAIEKLVESSPLGTGGALRQVLPMVTETALVMNGDSFCGFQYSDLLATLESQQVGFSLAALKIEEAGDYGSLDLAENNRVRGFIEKGRIQAGWINAGVYALNRQFIERYIPERPCSLECDILPVRADAGDVGSLRVSGFFHDIGTPGRLEAAQTLFPPADLLGLV